MNNRLYTFRAADQTTGEGRPLLLHDGNFRHEHDYEIDALVASGDCFVTLATTIDHLTHSLPAHEGTAMELEKLVRILLYLQRHYQITKKQPNYRQ